jgi:hypothetical protein
VKSKDQKRREALYRQERFNRYVEGKGLVVAPGAIRNVENLRKKLGMEAAS